MRKHFPQSRKMPEGADRGAIYMAKFRHIASYAID
jgi:hypothetical protein